LKPYLLLDAGWTLLFPDHRVIRQVIAQHGYEISAEHVQRLMAEFVKGIDDQLGRGEAPGFDLFGYIARGSAVATADVPLVVKALETVEASDGLWKYTFPWVLEALASLAAQGYRMSVISNAQGHVAQEMEQVGLARHLERIYDSHVVGYAKPDVRLFQHALDGLGLQPEECIYVGDIYYIDVLGANRAGIAAVHLDRYNLYERWPGYHLPSVAALPELLGTEGLDLRDERFFPLR
jgi:putative hydrolase of the HAD superfamily